MRSVHHMKRLLVLIVALCALAAPAPVQAQEIARGAVVRIPVSGVIEMGLAPFVERTIAEAESAGARAVILDIETPGGRIDAAERIVDAVRNSKVPVYAFVNMRAFSAGAVIALAARDIYMRPGSVMGAATPVTGDGTKAPEKIVSAMRSEMRGLAEARGLDPRVAEAMVDESIGVPGLVEPGKLLTLTAAEAVRVGYAKEVADWDALMETLALEDAPVRESRVNWAERAVRFLTHPMVAPLLLSLGMLGLIIEIKTPTFGLAGAAGAAALTAFFGSHFLLGLAGWEEVILLGIGILLIAIEMFVLPGFGIAGIAGTLAIFAAFFLSMVTSMDTGADYARALGVISLSILVVILGAWAILRRLPRSRGLAKSGLLLADATTRETGYLSNEIRTELIGTVGVAVTDLRPSGAGRFGNERIDVVSDANWISAGTPIKVVRSDGYRHVVEPAD
jgi:membrane-bound serine protease (ClpP class)